MALTKWQERENGAVLYSAHLREMDGVAAYGICKVRQDVFVLEQQVTSEPELDGVDLDAETTLVWWQQGNEVLGTIRVLTHAEFMQIGRLAMAEKARRGGYGFDLMQTAIEICRQQAPAKKIIIHGQAYLQKWYDSMGYVTVSDLFYEAGIAHYEMEYTHAEQKVSEQEHNG